MTHLFCFGAGFSAQALAPRIRAAGGTLAGTTRTADKGARFEALGIRPVLFGPDQPLSATALDGATHILVSVPPGEDGDPVLAQAGDQLADAAPRLRWIGYLSTTGVYGDHEGGWVDEDTPLNPAGERGERRVAAEAAWQTFGRTHGVPVQIFRLAGIYGPGRNALETVLAGTAKRIDKPGQVFSRIHVEDIAVVLEAAIAQAQTIGERIFNVCDDEPAPPADVITHACSLLEVEPPPLVPYAEIAPTLSPMARSFYGESKRCRNDRIKQDLGIRLTYPTYREGLAALLADLRSQGAVPHRQGRHTPVG